MNSQFNISQEELDLIDQYLAANLPADALQAFEQRMLADADWKGKVQQVQLIAMGIGEASLRQKMEGFHAGMDTGKSTTPVRKINFAKWVAAAAVLAAVFIVGKFVFFNQGSNQKIYASFYKQDPGLPTAMGLSDNYSFDHAMVSYKTGEYKSAMEEWQKLATQYPASDTLHYFIASAAMGDKQWQKAVTDFDKVISTTHSAFAEEACWYKGLALLQLNNKTEAIAAIKASNHPRKNEILSKLENK